MNRSLWYVGLLLLVAGATLTAVPGGYSSITGGGEEIPATSADAPVTLAATGNQVVDAGEQSETDAATEQTTDTATESSNRTPGDRGVPIAALINDVDTSVTVRYEASVAVDAVALGNPNGTVTIREGGQQPVFARCAAAEADAGTGELRVTIVRANASGTTITGVELTTQFRYDCPGRASRNETAA